MSNAIISSLSTMPQTAESVVRSGLGSVPEVGKKDKNAELHARAHRLAIEDMVTLASRAGDSLSVYGGDARYAVVTQGMRENVSEKTLSSIGAGKDSSSVQPKKTFTGKDGSVWTVESAAGEKHIKARENNGIGVDRHFTETVVRESGEKGVNVRQTRTLKETSADAAKGTMTQTLESEISLSKSADNTIARERRATVIVYSMDKDKNLHKSIREVLNLSIVNATDGSVLKMKNSESISEEVLDAKNGSLSIQRSDSLEHIDNNDKNEKLTQSIRRTERVAIALADSESKAPKVGKVTVEEKRQSVERKQNDDGSAAEVTALQSKSIFKGTGTAVDNAFVATYAQAAWRKENGEIGAGARERIGSFALKKDEKDPTKTVLASSAATVRTTNVGLLGKKIFLQTYNDSIDTDPDARGNGINEKTWGIGVNAKTYDRSGGPTDADSGKSASPYFFTKKWSVNTVISTDTKNAASGPYRAGGRYEVKDGIVTIRPVDTRSNSPTVVLDIANRSMKAMGVPSESGASVSADGKLEAHNAQGLQISGARANNPGTATSNTTPAGKASQGNSADRTPADIVKSIVAKNALKLEDQAALPKKLEVTETRSDAQSLLDLYNKLQDKQRRLNLQNNQNALSHAGKSAEKTPKPFTVNA